MIVDGFKFGARDRKTAATLVVCRRRSMALAERGRRASTFRRRGLGGQHPLYRADEVAVIGLDASTEARDLLAVAIDKIFVKVPFGTLPGAREEFGVQRIGLDAGHARFLEHRKLHAIGQTTEFGNLLVAARLLAAEVVR